MNLGNWSPTFIEIVAAVTDARIDEHRGFGWHAGSYPALADVVNEECTAACNASFFRPENETVNPNRGTGRTHHFAGR